MNKVRLLGVSTLCFTLAAVTAVGAAWWACAAFTGLCALGTLALLAMEWRNHVR